MIDYKSSFEVRLDGAFKEATFTPEEALKSYDRYFENGGWSTIELVQLDYTLLKFAVKPLSEGSQ